MQEQQCSLVYSLQLSGINCTNCQRKIKTNLNEKVQSGLEKVSVNILQEKVSIAVNNEGALTDSIDVLNELGYKIVGEPNLIRGGGDFIRTVSFIYEINHKSELLQNMIRSTTGVTSTHRVHSGSSIKLTVSYDCTVVHGRQIADMVEDCDQNYETINHRVQSFKSVVSQNGQKHSIKATIFLCLFFLIFDMFLPLTGGWYMDLLTLPSTDFGPFTFSVIINFLLTITVLNIYAKPVIIRSYRNYVENGSMDMETLISLGCVSAFLLFIFFMGRHTYEFLFDSGNKYQTTGHDIMEINDALASSAIIVLVVTIGKHFEGKVKRKIEQITDNIFPQSKLFEEMNVEFVKLKNRKFKIENTKNYDVTVLEKDDLYKLRSGRVLLDSIVLEGEFQAVQSAVDGNDEISTLKKGERLQSGSIIMNCTDNGLLQVQKVFEKSVLIQIGTHIKLRQNEEENKQSGIQAVCKTISRYFVKAVIMISLLVMATWFFLLSFNYVKVPGCNFCWILQRGIGVVVASCPCALGLAVPSVVAIVLNIAIQNGILIRNSGVLQKMKKCKVISFDKTGTLFTRINSIEQYHLFEADDESLDEKKLWETVAVVEKQILHPIAEILYKESFQRSGVEGTNFGILLNKPVEVRKEGLAAEVLHKKQQKIYNVLIGNKSILQNNGIQVPAFEKTGHGATVLYLAMNQEVKMVMVINTHSNLRPEAKKIVELLMKKHKQVHILSGDSRESVQQLGNALGLPNQYLHPEHSAFMKMQWIKEVQKDLEEDNGIGVIMVGDGLNDIPCLQQASIGISINAKSQLNINAADIIMLSENLYKIVALVNLLHRGNTFININLFWAFLYNLTIMPIVAGLFYGYGVTISPVWSSIAMSCSSILVVAFSHILSLFKYDEDPSHRVNNGPQCQLNTSDVDSPLKKKIIDKQYAILNEESIRI